MNQSKETRRASEFDGKRHDGWREPVSNRPHDHFNGLADMRKRLLTWLHVGR